MKSSFFIILLFTSSFLACQKKQSLEQGVKKRFARLTAKETGIHFENAIKETGRMNGLMYEYLYNGGGVAVGDFNNDNLPDLYFVANLKPNALYINKGNLTFEETTQQSGVKGKYGFHTGVTTVDINHDGLLDIYVCKSGSFNDPDKYRNELYINQGVDANGIPRFLESAQKYGLDIATHATQASFFDYDKDGDLDMFLINYGVKVYAEDSVVAYLEQSSGRIGERLYRNDNDFYYDVTAQSGIINNKIGFGLGLAIGDLNNDTWPDVLVSNDYSEKDHVYINQRDGTFREYSREMMSHQSFFSMGNDIADINNDGLADMITLDMTARDNYNIKASMSGMNPTRFKQLVDWGLHHQYMYNTLQVNLGIHGGLPRFADIGQLAGVESTDWSWAPLFCDLDNDGNKDLFVSNGIKRDFRNNDFLIFYKKKQEELVDIIKKKKKIDIDSFLLAALDKMPTRKKVNLFYQNKGDMTFEQKNGEWLDDIPTSSNGATYADLDNDGDLDIVVNNMDDEVFVYKNLTTDKGEGNTNYIQLKLVGSKLNPEGIGARIEIKSDSHTQYFEHYFTRGFQSAVGRVVHVGLGDKKQVDRITVIWPDGKQQTLKDISANQQLVIQHANAIDQDSPTPKGSKLFEDANTRVEATHPHKENPFDDYQRESLLPHKMSQFGPALAVGDVNGDGQDDFYLGGSHKHAGQLYLAVSNGKFQKTNQPVFSQDKYHEDVAAILVDMDGDGDKDLYVVSGGNEFENDAEYYQDRIYENIGLGKFQKAVKALPSITISGGCVVSYDFDGDGDEDLFIGGRLAPGKYPYPASSMLLENQSQSGQIRYADASNKIPELSKLGMVTSAVWADIDNDDYTDLILAGEWMSPKVFKNQKGKSFIDISAKSGLEAHVGWWFSLAAADVDQDGDQDLVGGNLGLNYKYKATADEPFQVYSTDFDENGTIDIVLGYYDQGKAFPLRGRQCSSNQMPFIKKKFPTYDQFASATLTEVYGNKLDKALHYQATHFATSYMENKGNGQFTVTSLPVEAQVSSVNTILIEDMDKDSHLDIVLAGNMYGVEVETIRNDAGHGLFLKGDGKGNFKSVPVTSSGLYVPGDVKAAQKMILDEKRYIIFARNSDQVHLVEVKE